MTAAALPAKYRWLEALELPRTIVEGLRLYGTKEVPGAVNAPAIMEWAKETRLSSSYVADAVPWCGLFAAVVAQRAGWEPVASPLWARNWAKFGVESRNPGLGDVLVFKRDSSGHVGFYVGEDETAFHVLGGNQGDQVSIVRVAKNRLIASRRPKWKVSQPSTVKPYHLASGGELSNHEA